MNNIFNIKFNPWISENFKNGTSKYGKILIFGESHYGVDNEDDSNFTIDVINEFLDGETYSAYKMYTNIGLLFNENDKLDIWQNCAYSNLIQYFMSDCDDQPQKEQLESIIPAFWNILELVKPEKVIICSKRAWENWMPDSDERCRKIDEVSIDNLFSSIWEYDYSGGKCKAIGINHPTSIGFSHNKWRPLVQKFINEK
jgi:hypothetical protein